MKQLTVEDLNKMSDTEIKALIYDQMAIISVGKRTLEKLEQILDQRASAKLKQKEKAPEPADAPEGGSVQPE